MVMVMPVLFAAFVFFIAANIAFAGIVLFGVRCYLKKVNDRKKKAQRKQKSCRKGEKTPGFLGGTEHRIQNIKKSFIYKQ